ncbi:unnamed protein product [Blepharisma stoltei]|uniref:Uncharacterized protein n=1 Tax=Blepharisma stoltei TaxID=1481888 RepID=A0AAU9JRJ1_9CILI|nr:unnamed protein product [Blepharisma stoltei]
MEIILNMSKYRSPSKASSKISDLMSFLETQDQDSKFSYLEEFSNPDPDTLSAYSETKAKIMTLKIELEESNKNIDSLKAAIEKLKLQKEEAEKEWQTEMSRKLERQREEYEAIIEKNVNFIENLLQEKAQRDQLINELKKKIKENEASYMKILSENEEKYKKEMKKVKDNWITQEKLRREKWEKEKTREIKEMTAKGLEPEITKLITDNKKNIEEREETHKRQLRQLRDDLKEKHHAKLKKLKEQLTYQYDEIIEKEKELNNQKIREIIEEKDIELQNIRRRWSDELIEERARMDTILREEIKRWQEKVREAENRSFK